MSTTKGNSILDTNINNKLFFYKIYGLNIKSEIKLMNIEEISKGSEDVTIRFGKISISSNVIVRGENFKVTSDGIYLFWKDIGCFKICNEREIIVDTNSNCPDKVIPFILGPVLAVISHLRGKLVLHASVVKMDNHAVAFMGDKENGKSTTAMSMHIEGYPLITDDILVVDIDKNSNLLVYPGYPYLRLSDDIVKVMRDDLNFMSKINTKYEKNFLSCFDGFSTDPIKLRAIYLVEKYFENLIYPLKPNEALIDLVKNTFTVKLFQDSDKILNLNQCSKIVREVPINRLKIQQSLEKLPNLVKIIEENFKSIDNNLVE